MGDVNVKTVVRIGVAFMFAAAIGGGGGCTALEAILQGVFAPSPDDGSDGGDTNGPGVPAVTLTVSNPTPQLNETVVLQCSVIGSAGETVTFAFQPDDPRLIVNPTTGTASFVVQESDVVGAGLTFTCTATSAGGTSPPSNEVVIIPTGS
jgi:hypothetical protein